MKWPKSGKFVFLLIFLSTTWAAPAPVPFADEDSFRLPTSSVPIRYDLTLTTNVHLANGQRAFSGNVKIEIEIKENSNLITLHNRGLSIQSVKLTDDDGEEVEITFTPEAEKDFLHIQSPDHPLQAVEHYTIEIAFTGQLQTGTSGFYRSSYNPGTGTR